MTEFDFIGDPEKFLTACFFVALAAMATMETLIPLRRNRRPLSKRWPGNFLLFIVNNILFIALLPIGAILFARHVQDQGWGLFNTYPLPLLSTLLLSVLLLDFIKYAQHLLFHYFTPFWRFHLPHHSDQDYDFTTGLRFHPLEFSFTTATTFITILLFGVPPYAVFVFELLTLILNSFQHANVRTSPTVERAMRLIFVSPGMHRIHHSAWEPETNSNFGVIFSFWDKVFGTYRATARQDQKDMKIGLFEYQEPADLSFARMLVQPFSKLKPKISSAEVEQYFSGEHQSPPER